MTHRYWPPLALAALLVASLAFVACGDDDDDANPNVGLIGGVSESATYAWVSDGTMALYDYLAADVTNACTPAEVTQALADHQQPQDWQQIKDVEISDGAATATVILVYENDRVDEDWGFAKEGESWRISHIPGLESCEG